MFTDAAPPTAEAFRLAIARLSDRLTELQRRIFKIHFSLPALAMTSQRLRDELGYKGIAKAPWGQTFIFDRSLIFLHLKLILDAIPLRVTFPLVALD